MWTFFVDHFDDHTEGLRDHEDIAEDYSSVKEASITLNRLKSDCRGNFRVTTDGKEVASAFSFMVL